jgi:Collagen triple helix repeat (20 copies)
MMLKRRLILLIFFAVLLNPMVATNAPLFAAGNTEIKNCVNIKTGKARIVSPSTTKCKAGEKLVYLVIPLPNSIELSNFHSGTTPPIDFVTGHDGDFYIDTANAHIYGPRKNGLWGEGISLVGPKGETGPQGAPGMQGAQGAIGLQGLKGETGTVGAVGPQGLKGETGTVGATGPAGATGATGATGAVGATGAQGPQGIQGLQGVQGLKGDTGTTGAKGDPGGFGYYGSFYDTGTVTLTANQSLAIPLRVTDFSNGVTIEKDSLGSFTKIRFQYAGKYNIAFSLQLSKTDSGTDITSIWICTGSGSSACTNVPWTTTDIYMLGNSARQVAAWNFFVNLSANDYVQLLISPGTSTGTSILASPAASGPTRPEIPSTILTVNQVG